MHFVTADGLYFFSQGGKQQLWRDPTERLARVSLTGLPQFTWTPPGRKYDQSHLTDREIEKPNIQDVMINE